MQKEMDFLSNRFIVETQAISLGYCQRPPPHGLALDYGARPRQAVKVRASVVPLPTYRNTHVQESNMKTSVMAAAVAAALSLAGLAQAQESPDTLQSMPSQAQQNVQAAPGGSAYGGTLSSQSASGKASILGTRNGNNCTPLPFCNVYTGGQ
jgi:hypothetical protein